MFLEHYFDRYTFQPEKGLAYGFEKSGTGYEYQCPVLSDSFLLKVRVCDQKISFQVYDQDTGDEYIQIHQEQLQGNFVGQVREACQESLARIRQACFEVENFSILKPSVSWPISLCTIRERLSICGRDLQNLVPFATETPSSGMVSL